MEEIAHTYPLVWDAVDCISLLFKQTMQAGASLPGRAVTFLEHKRTQRFEAGLLSRLQPTVVTPERERQPLGGLLGNATTRNREQGPCLPPLPNAPPLNSL